MNELYYEIINRFELYNSHRFYSLVESNPDLLDAVFCAFMILIYLPFFVVLIKNRGKYGCGERKIKFKKEDTIACLIIAMGVGGLSNIWFFITETVLSDVRFLMESSKEFEEAFESVDTNGAYFWSLLSIVILGPIVEEMIFRGFVYRFFDKIKGGSFAIIASGILFGIWHIIAIQIVYTAMIGIVLGIAYYSKQNFTFPIIIHIINNFASTLPPALDKDITYDVLYIINFICIIPMIIILYSMVRNRGKVMKQA